VVLVLLRALQSVRDFVRRALPAPHEVFLPHEGALLLKSLFASLSIALVCCAVAKLLRLRERSLRLGRVLEQQRRAVRLLCAVRASARCFCAQGWGVISWGSGLGVEGSAFGDDGVGISER
jgi:hypothetical protein